MLAYMGLICLLFSLFVIPDVKCSKLHRRYSGIEEGNDYLDRVIQDTIDENRHNLEPYRPQNVTFNFEKKILLVTFTGEAALHDIAITGLSTVHREGDCKRSVQNGVSKLSANLGMGVLEFDSKATIKFMNVGPNVKLSGEIGYAMIHLEASRDFNAGTPAQIDRLEIYDLKGTKLKVSGLGLGIINRVATKVTEGAAKLFQGKIKKGMEKKLRDSLKEKIESRVFPLD